MTRPTTRASFKPFRAKDIASSRQSRRGARSTARNLRHLSHLSHRRLAPVAPEHLGTRGTRRIAPAHRRTACARRLAPWRRHHPGSASWLADGPNRPSPTAQADRIRVAVLPFVNLTGDSGASYLADGLTDDVIAQLGRLGGKRLAVVARTSAMAFRDTTKTIGQIGRELKATYVVESSLRRDGNTLRVGSSLVPTGDEAPVAVWSETFRRRRRRRRRHRRTVECCRSTGATDCH